MECNRAGLAVQGRDPLREELQRVQEKGNSARNERYGLPS